MKNILKNRLLTLLLAAAFAVPFVSCSDWTDAERVEIKEPDMEHDNPELYAKYLAALREYKQSAGHKVVYAWFDNSVKVTASRGQRIETVPDSVDVISLMYSDNLTSREIADIAKVRTKGTRVVYTIAYDSLTESYKAYLEQFAAEPPSVEADDAPAVAKTLAEYAVDYSSSQIALCAKYNYDGVVVSYNGKELTHSTPDQIAEYTAIQTAFFAPIVEWKAANPSKMLSLLGRAHNILNKDIVALFEHIIVPTHYAASTVAIAQEIRKSVAEGAPADRFVAMVMTTSLDKSDIKTGYFGSDRALTMTAYWVATPEVGYTKAGVAIYNVQNDFYNPLLIYKYTREAISIMN